ncbi:hypothetical protein GCM10010275_24610 [Streptomyces litmocidini]|uniref:hypothetical protein n=1 Tax=Streptomyces litmocidini TaxID=67318 RepID=UPI00167C994F|nr:hypothetical protein [Streptomyces litmocidini]GGU87649.1 hypothetical protein GCM10010275_24610 [Streptomyces litmocidini]
MAPAPLRLRGVRVAVSVAAATAAPFVSAAPALAAPAPDPPTPACGIPDDGGFPLGTRIHGGPDDYPAGGPFQGWKLDLTNTTDAPCSGVHPVLVLTDRDRALRPEQIRFEFYDAGSALWRPVVFESTEDAENVGAFTGFGGFAVPAGRTLTVPVRLAFDAGTAPDEVVVNAAVVQRQGEDGDWVGESGDYRLTVGPAGSATPATPTAPTTPPAPDTSRAPDSSAPPAEEARPPASRPPASRPPATRAPASRGPERPAEAAADSELAGTGGDSEAYARVLVPLAAGLLLLGAVLVRAARRSRHR